jgi:murein L,D-transpeptidase YcbB/YkuD
LDTSGLNPRGLTVIGLAVAAAVILLAVVPKEGPLGGVKTATTTPATTLAPATTAPGPSASTAAGATTTTKAATTTTKRGSTTTSTTTTTINPASRPVLKRGDSGPDVVTLQQKLAAAGFNPGTADGNFGAATQTAVMNFQRSKNLPADGVVGPSTWAALG